eukprot:scaffold338_cov377-Prasinococcus_capsulatus_cf.AAC.12
MDPSAKRGSRWEQLNKWRAQHQGRSGEGPGPEHPAIAQVGGARRPRVSTEPLSTSHRGNASIPKVVPKVRGPPNHSDAVATP